MLLPPLWTVRHPPRLEAPCEQDGVSFTTAHIQPESSCHLPATVRNIFSSPLTLSFFWAASLMTPFLSLLLSSSSQCYSQYKLWKEKVLLFESLALCRAQCPTLRKSITSMTMILCVLNTYLQGGSFWDGLIHPSSANSNWQILLKDSQMYGPYGWGGDEGRILLPSNIFSPCHFISTKLELTIFSSLWNCIRITKDLPLIFN